MAFDFGLRHIGVAIASPLSPPRPLIKLTAQQGRPDWHQLSKLLQEWQPTILVVGLPLNMDGTTQPLTKIVQQFSIELQQRFNLPVNLQDERLSTVEARTYLFEQGGYRALKKPRIDAMAAALILQSWLTTVSPAFHNRY